MGNIARAWAQLDDQKQEAGVMGRPQGVFVV